MAENTADFVAGWASGAVATLATQPVDLVITRLQAGTARSISGAISAEPLTALWRGMGPLLAVQPISNALMFVGYGAGKSYAERNQLTGGIALLPVFLGGCAGGCAQSLAQSPAELLKVRMQLSGHSHAPSARALLSEGGLSRGMAATLWRDVLPHGLWFASYDSAKTYLQRRQAAAAPAGATTAAGAAPPLPVASQLAAGAFAATVAWLAGYPWRCYVESTSGQGSAWVAQDWRQLASAGVTRRQLASTGVIRGSSGVTWRRLASPGVAWHRHYARGCPRLPTPPARLGLSGACAVLAGHSGRALHAGLIHVTRRFDVIKTRCQMAGGAGNSIVPQQRHELLLPKQLNILTTFDRYGHAARCGGATLRRGGDLRLLRRPRAEAGAGSAHERDQLPRLRAGGVY